MAPRRFSLSNLSIKHRLPLLIGTLLLGVIAACTWVAYRGVKESALEVGRARLLNVTEQLASLSQQSSVTLANKTLASANDPAIKAFLSSPSSTTSPGANGVLGQFAAPQEPNSLQVELWDATRSRVLSWPADSSALPADLSFEFDTSAVEPFKALASKLATMGELAASIAHELNNPLATVALRAESALEALPLDDPKRHSLEVISQEVERMATLVSNLLLFSRRSHRQLSTLDLREELTNSLDFIQYHLRSHKVEVVVDFAAFLPTVQADQQQLRQVFLNLITNASDAMPNGGTLTVRSRAGITVDGQSAAIIEFADTGTGVKTGDLPKLWEPFFTTKPEGKGTGLGLSICRRTVEEHCGTIEIETSPGEGMTVRIILPATSESIEVAA